MIPSIHQVWTPERGNELQFVELYGYHNGKYAYHMCVYRPESGWVQVVDIR